MSVILQIDFPMPANMMGENLVKQAIPLAESIAQEPGLISKIWTENPETSEAGGIYLFTDRESANRYKEMHVKRIEAMGLKNINCKIFDINEPLTKITKGIF